MIERYILISLVVALVGVYGFKHIQILNKEQEIHDLKVEKALLEVKPLEAKLEVKKEVTENEIKKELNTTGYVNNGIYRL